MTTPASSTDQPRHDAAVGAVEVNGTSLLVRQVGSGEPVVLVHGSWDDHGTWALVEDDLAAHLHVVSYDRRGHGGSHSLGTAAPGPGSRRQDEDDLAALIEAWSLAPAHVVGDSFGASIALGFAIRHADLVSSVAAHEPPLLALAAENPIVAELEAALRPVLSLIERGEAEAGARAFFEAVIGPGAWEDRGREEQEAMIRNASTFLDEQRDPEWATVDLEALSCLSCPVLLTQSDQSPPVFSEITARLGQHLEDVTTTTFRGAGHEPHLTHSDEWHAIVRHFVSGTD